MAALLESRTSRRAAFPLLLPLNVFYWLALAALRLASDHFSFSSKLAAAVDRCECAPPPTGVREREPALSREEIEGIVEAMSGMRLSGDGCHDGVEVEELGRLFDDEEPSLEEVRAAFDVFDADSDGQIDASDLQRVLCRLGAREGKDLEACRRMIAGSGAQDGKLGLAEFTRVLEASLS